MSEKVRLLLFLVGALILSALITRAGELLYLAMPLFIYLIFGLVQAPTEIRLVATRTLSRHSINAYEGVEARIQVINKGDGLVNLTLSDTHFPSMAISEGQTRQILYLPAGETKELHYDFKPARGVYSWSSVHACASDPFGLFERECEVSAPGELLVRPSPIRIRPVTLGPPSSMLAAGPIPARLAGAGTDYWGVREYKPGDPLRRLNWRLAARHPRKLFTNEYEREEIADFGLILDTRRLSNTQVMEEALFEHSVSAAASLGESYIKQGNRVSLLIFGKSMHTVFPGYGKHQLNLLLWSLAHARLDAYLPFDYLEYFPTRLFPARSQVIIFSSLDARDLGAYARLRSYGFDVLLISPDPVDYAARMLPSAEVNALAVRAARIERISQLKRLLKMGVKVVDWQVDKPLDTVLHLVMRQYLLWRTR